MQRFLETLDQIEREGWNEHIEGIYVTFSDDVAIKFVRGHGENYVTKMYERETHRFSLDVISLEEVLRILVRRSSNIYFWMHQNEYHTEYAFDEGRIIVYISRAFRFTWNLNEYPEYFCISNYESPYGLHEKYVRVISPNQFQIWESETSLLSGHSRFIQLSSVNTLDEKKQMCSRLNEARDAWFWRFGGGFALLRNRLLRRANDDVLCMVGKFVA